MIDRFRVVPAAYLVLRRGDEILLQLRQDTGYMDGYWAASAAGHVEADESVLAAVEREAAEELGISLEPGAVVPLCGMHRTHGNHQPIDERVDFFFECHRWVGEPVLLEEKAADLQWFRLSDLPDPVVPHELFVFEHLRDGRPLPAIVTFGF